MSIQFIAFFRMQAAVVNQNRKAKGLNSLEGQVIDKISTLLQLLVYIRDINTSALEFDGNRYQRFVIHLTEKE